MTATERMRDMRAKHKEKGLCIHCVRPVLAGYVVCEVHREYFTVRNQRPETKAKQNKYYKARLRKRAMASVFGNESGAAA